MPGTYGTTTKLGIDTVSPVTARFNFISDGVRLVQEHVQTAGNVGTRSEPSERVRGGLKRVGGPITLRPNLFELNLLLEWIMGGAPIVGTPVGKTTFPLADTLPTRFVTSDRGSKVFTFDTVAVDTATFRSTQGGPLELTLDLVGKDETVGNAGTFPAIQINLATAAFMHSELVLTINSITHKCPDVEIVVSNLIDRERFFNSEVLTSVQPTARLITLNTRLPYGDSSVAYDLAVAGVAANAKWTNGSFSLEAIMPRLHVPRETPPIEGRQEVMLPITAVARKEGTTPGTTDELSLILDLTP